MTMRRILATCLFAVATGTAFGGRRTLPNLPPPDSPDTEVSLSYAFNRHRQDARNFGFVLTFNGTASNNVEVALGRDADGDGRLSFAETDMRIGWDCGRYFVERTRTGEVFGDANAGTNGITRTLSWEVRMDKEFCPSAFSASTEAGEAFGNLGADGVPGWIFRPDWNLMRLTARGTDVQDEHFTVDVQYNYFRLILR